MVIYYFLYLYKNIFNELFNNDITQYTFNIYINILTRYINY